MADRVRLEFTELEILTKKERWQLYLVVTADHPEEAGQSIVTILPSQGKFLRLKTDADNRIPFVPEGSSGVNGWPIIERDLPDDGTLNVQVQLYHCRKNGRNVMQDVQKHVGGKAVDLSLKALGVAVPWIAIATVALKEVSGALAKMKDRDFGFINMYEDFADQDPNETRLPRTNKFSTGEARIEWNWIVIKP